jgi:hypothetical protein
LEEGLYCGLKTRIVDSEARIEHQFTHFLDENKGVRMEEFHDVVAVTEAIPVLEPTRRRYYGR